MDLRFQRPQARNDFGVGRSRAQWRAGLVDTIQQAQERDPLRRAEAGQQRHVDRSRSRSPAQELSRGPCPSNGGQSHVASRAERLQAFRERIRGQVREVTAIVPPEMFTPPSSIPDLHSHRAPTQNAFQSSRFRPGISPGLNSGLWVRQEELFANRILTEIGVDAYADGQSDSEVDEDWLNQSIGGWIQHDDDPNLLDSEDEDEEDEEAEDDTPQIGVSRSVIDTHTVVMTMSSPNSASIGSSTSDKRENECMVCLEGFSAGQRLRVLPCFHRYHCMCIEEWLLRDKHCPLCKHDITQ